MTAILMPQRAAFGDPDSTASASTRRPSFGDTVLPYLDRLYGYCMRLVGDPVDAEDLLQETLLRAMRGYDNLRDHSRTKGWLFAIATNCWHDHGRTKGREVTTTSLDAIEGSGTVDDFSLFDTIAVEDPFPYSDELHLDFLRLFRDEDVQAIFGSPSGRSTASRSSSPSSMGSRARRRRPSSMIPLGTCLSRLYRGRKQTRARPLGLRRHQRSGRPCRRRRT